MRRLRAGFLTWQTEGWGYNESMGKPLMRVVVKLLQVRCPWCGFSQDFRLEKKSCRCPGCGSFITTDQVLKALKGSLDSSD